MKKVLILCTGNSCRSIIAEALINKEFKNSIIAHSSGVQASGKINENAKKVLQLNDAWDNQYYSKTIDKVINNDYDLVVTVCDNAKESCPVFPKKIDILHIGFEDPTGKSFDEFIKTYNEIKQILLPKINNYFN